MLRLDKMHTKTFDIEHSLSLYAFSYAHFPAKHLYESGLSKRLGKAAKKAHIYFIGLVPIIKYENLRVFEKTNIKLDVSVAGASEEFVIPFDRNIVLTEENGLYRVFDEQDREAKFDAESVGYFFSKMRGGIPFEVQYVGQAYGKNGSRKAIDRLRRHEKLQEISLKGAPEGYQLEVILFEVQPNTSIMTVFNPFAKNDKTSKSRIKSGVDKLYDTTEIERITLYEASFIRYFEPCYNKEFKNSFPSTRMKILKDCYDKDFSAITAEIYFDDFYYSIFSQKQKAKKYHCSNINLHSSQEREMFFSP